MIREPMYTLKEYANHIGVSYTSLMSYKYQNDIELIEEKMNANEPSYKKHYPLSYLDYEFRGIEKNQIEPILRVKCKNVDHTVELDSLGTSELDTDWLESELVCNDYVLRKEG